MCEFCERRAENGQECGKDYPIHPCGNGDLGVRAEYIDGGIVLFKDHNIASGYFNINYCPICGRKIGQKKSRGEDSKLIPLVQVLDDMYNPNGGYASMAARDYYYQNYATDAEQKKMDREDKFTTAFAIIFMVVFWIAVGWAVVSQLM
jgi:hypothetical protein